MRKTLLATALGVALTGCAVGPAYQRPEVPVPARWEVNIQQANDFANTAWWDQFRDPVLNQLIQTALQENKDVQIATARVEEYMGRYGVTRSAQSVHANLIYSPFPKLDIGAELIWGNREVESGADGDLRRLHTTVKYSF